MPGVINAAQTSVPVYLHLILSVFRASEALGGPGLPSRGQHEPGLRGKSGGRTVSRLPGADVPTSHQWSSSGAHQNADGIRRAEACIFIHSSEADAVACRDPAVRQSCMPGLIPRELLPPLGFWLLSTPLYASFLSSHYLMVDHFLSL